MIDKQLLTKNGIAVMRLAREFISMQPGQRIETVGDYADKLCLGRGTIQSALRYLEDSGALRIDARGHLGTYIEGIDYKKLWEVAGLRSITGVMPLPYSRKYEGLATGMYKAFENADIPFNMAYMRGGYRREEALEQGKCDFIVMSMLAVQLNIESGNEIEIVMDFGRHSYVGGHKVLFSDPAKRQIEDGMKVGLDSSSIDHFILTCYECEGKNVDFVELSYNQILKSLTEGIIDAAVWNIDEVVDSGLNIKYYDLKNPKVQSLDEKDTIAAIAVKKSNWGINGILKGIIDKESVIGIQNKVQSGEIMPSY
jgi:hypothetical protein